MFLAWDVIESGGFTDTIPSHWPQPPELVDPRMASIHRKSCFCMLATSLLVLTVAEPQSSHLYLGGGLTILTQNLLDGK